jgi:hypothetical protein
MAGQPVYILIFLMSTARLEIRTLVGYNIQWNTKLVENKRKIFTYEKKWEHLKLFTSNLHPTEEILQNMSYINIRATVDLAS